VLVHSANRLLSESTRILRTLRNRAAGKQTRDFTDFVWFSVFQNSAGYGNYVAALLQSERWRGEVSDGLGRYLNKATEVLKLTPTARSQLR
jgi:predicted lipoprotein